MPPLINAQQISKTYGIAPLFKNISFTVSEGDRIGLIGPNGAGKSTLLQILEGRLKPDQRRRRGAQANPAQLCCAALRVCGRSNRKIRRRGLQCGDRPCPKSDRQSLMAETLGRAGFTDLDAEAASLSGGWRKRLAIVEGLVQAAGCSVPGRADQSPGSCRNSMARRRSADRNVRLRRGQSRSLPSRKCRQRAGRTQSHLRRRAAAREGKLQRFLQAKEDYLEHRGNGRNRSSIAFVPKSNGLRRGPKARGTKAKARIETAQEMIGELAELNAREAASAQPVSTSPPRTAHETIDGTRECGVADRRTELCSPAFI